MKTENAVLTAHNMECCCQCGGTSRDNMGVVSTNDKETNPHCNNTRGLRRPPFASSASSGTRQTGCESNRTCHRLLPSLSVFVLSLVLLGLLLGASGVEGGKIRHFKSRSEKSINDDSRDDANNGAVAGAKDATQQEIDPTVSSPNFCVICLILTRRYHKTLKLEVRLGKWPALTYLP